jgi:pimeloyl-ACP methyl ester carboxylesterase
MEDCDMLASFHWPETPKALVELDFDMANPPPWRSFPPPPIGGSLLTPGIIAQEAAAVRVPVLLVYGEVDVTADPLADVGMFLSTTDISMKIIPSMAHMHNFAPTRQAVWRQLSHFAVRVAEQNR